MRWKRWWRKEDEQKTSSSPSGSARIIRSSQCCADPKILRIPKRGLGWCGFTFIELVLLISLVSILSISAVPFFFDLGISQCDNAAKKLVSDIAYARRLAQNRNGTYGVSFDLAGDQYTVFLYDPVTALTTPVEDPLRRIAMVIDFDLLPGLQGVDLSNFNLGGNNEVRFNPQGIPLGQNGNPFNNATSITLTQGGTIRTILIQPRTGEVSYQ